MHLKERRPTQFELFSTARALRAHSVSERVRLTVCAGLGCLASSSVTRLASSWSSAWLGSELTAVPSPHRAAKFPELQAAAYQAACLSSWASGFRASSMGCGRPFRRARFGIAAGLSST